MSTVSSEKEDVSVLEDSATCNTASLPPHLRAKARACWRASLEVGEKSIATKIFSIRMLFPLRVSMCTPATQKMFVQPYGPRAHINFHYAIRPGAMRGYPCCIDNPEIFARLTCGFTGAKSAG